MNLKRSALLSSTAIVLAVLFSSGCSQSGQGEPEEQLDITSLAANTTPYQAEILEDEQVDPSEYEESALAVYDCVSREGFTPDDPVWVRGQLMFNVQFQNDDPQKLQEMSDRYDVVYDECWYEYTSEVSTVWANQMLLTTDERDAQRPDVVACLQAAGLELDDDDTDDKIFAAMTAESAEQWAPCQDEFPAYFMSSQAESDSGAHGHEH